MGNRVCSLPLTGIFLMGILILSGCEQDTAVYQPALAKLIEKADALKKANNPEAALCRLQAAADIDAKAFPVQYNLGVLYSQMGQQAQAVEHLKQALAIKPDEPNALYTLGMAYQGLGDEYFNAAQLTDPKARAELPETFRSLSKEDAIAKGKAAYGQALETYQQFLKVAPSADPGRQEVSQQIPLLEARLQAP